MMQVFPNGFLSQLYCLTGVAERDFHRASTQADFCDCVEGEVLIPPAWQEMFSDGELAGDRCCFLGADSFGGATIARIEKVEGIRVINALREMARLYGQPEDKVMRLLQGIFDHSALLGRLYDQGVDFVRAGDQDPRALIPAQTRA